MKMKPGNNKLRDRKLIIGLMLVLVVVLSGINCGHSDHQPAGTEAGHVHAEGDAADHQHEATETAEIHARANGRRALTLNPALIKQWGIQYTEVKEKDYVETISLTGVIKTNQETTVIVNALVPGVVSAMKKDISDPVKKGDLLCILNSPGLLKLKTNYIKAFQDFRLTRENYERARKLFAIKGLEKKELTSRESAYKTSMAEFFSLGAELGTIGFSPSTLESITRAVQQDRAGVLKTFLSPYYHILSPSSGKVMMRNLKLGQGVERNNAIFEISDTRKMWALLDALEKDLPYIEKNKPVQITTDVYPGEYFNGRVLTLMEKIDPALRTLKVRVEVGNPGGRLKPDMYVRGQVQKKLERKRAAVPVKALVKLSGIDGVFIIDEGEFLFKAVQVIETDSAGFAFVNGLKLGEMVISQGSFYLKAEYGIQSSKSDPNAGHGHSH